MVGFQRILYGGLCSGAIFYLALLSYLHLVNDRALALISGTTLSLVGIAVVGRVLTLQAKVVQTLLAYLVAASMLTVAVTADGFFLHPGLAKDVDWTVAGVIEHAARIFILIALPGCLLATVGHLIARTVWSFWRRQAP